MQELIDRYGDPLRLVGDAPLTAHELYLLWAGVSDRKSLSARERNERRWLAKHLQSVARRGQIERRAITTTNHREYITFNRSAR
jgi:hypothetical protein